MARPRRRQGGVFTWIWLFITVTGSMGFALLALHLLHANDETGGDDTPSPQPRVLLLADLPNVQTSYEINYFTSSDTSAGSTTYGPHENILPTRVREFTFSFHGATPGATLNWVLLLNRDASMTQPIANEARGDVQVTTPGAQITSGCSDVKTFDTSQVLSGQVILDQNGNAAVGLHGGVNPSVQYTERANRTAVDVMSMVPAVPEAANGAECTATLFGWDQVNGSLWKTPRLTSGVVHIGPVPAAHFVESSNPPVADPQSLTWNLQGPAAVSYTLFDNAGQQASDIHVFWAGAFAALAAALLVEAVKTVLDLARQQSPATDTAIHDDRPEREMTAAPDPVTAAAGDAPVRAAKGDATWQAGVAGALTALGVTVAARSLLRGRDRRDALRRHGDPP